MDSESQAVIRFVSEQLQQHRDCWLVTVIRTWGSAPRLPGACFAWSEAGTCGSLSGGCVEEELIEKLATQQFASQQRPFIHQYGVTREDAERQGLPCGGRLELLLEWLPASSAQRDHFVQLNQALQHRQGLQRTVYLDVEFQSGQTATLQPSKPIPLSVNRKAVSYYLGPRYRLLIIGANQVAQYLVQFTTTLDFDIWVCDPREDAFVNWPTFAVQHFNTMPDDIIRDQANDPLTAIVAVAHDPRIDDMALMEALKSQAFYIGAMGSKKTTRKRQERLLQLGISSSQLKKLHAPIGLAIGSKTPAEIALAIAADLVNTIRAPGHQP